MLNPCTREPKVRTGSFLKAKLISDHGLFSSYEGQQGVTNGQDSWGMFQGCTGLWAGLMLARAPASPGQGLHHHGHRYYNFPCFSMTCGFENLGLLVKTYWSVICPLFLLRTLAVGRQRRSESIEVALSIELGGLMNRIDIGRVPLLVKCRITCCKIQLRRILCNRGSAPADSIYDL